MKIAFITPGQLPVPPALGGSVETYVDEITRALVNHQITTYSACYEDWPIEEMIQGVTHKRVDAPSWVTYLGVLVYQIQGEGFDIIQVENRPGFIPLLKEVVTGSKIVLNLHSLTFVLSDKFRRDDILECLNQADLINVNSQFIAKRLNQLFPTLKTPINIIHLAANPQKFPSRYNSEGQRIRRVLRKRLRLRGKKIVMFAGRLVRSKGVHFLMRALKRLPRGKQRCVLLVAGGLWPGNNNKTPYIRMLTKLAKRTGVKTVFLRYIPNQFIKDYYLAADVLVCPSIGPEAFGLVNVEAMATGMPVIASKVGGISEIVEHRKSGFLVPAKSSRAIAAALTNLWLNPTLPRKLGLNGRHRVEQYFNWERVGRQLETVYQKLLSGQIGREHN